jgi:hypothetical protein
MFKHDHLRKALPVLKTDKEVEEEGFERLSLDLPSFHVTEEPESIKKTNDPIVKTRMAERSGPYVARHSIGFDVPGAVHTIMTPSIYVVCVCTYACCD